MADGQWGVFLSTLAGMTYCAVAALSLLGHLDDSGLENIDGLVKWLVHRQVPFEKKDAMQDDDWQHIHDSGSEEEKADATKIELGTDGRPLWGGFHGRCNKKADTCYSFWIGASLDVSLSKYTCCICARGCADGGLCGRWRRRRR